MFASNRPLSSETFVLPRMIAPAASSLATSFALAAGVDFCRAIEPPVVGRPFASIVSSSSTGMPCSGPRSLPRLRSASSCAGLGERARVGDVAHGLDRRAVRVGRARSARGTRASASAPTACPPSSAPAGPATDSVSSEKSSSGALVDHALQALVVRVAAAALGVRRGRASCRRSGTCSGSAPTPAGAASSPAR